MNVYVFYIKNNFTNTNEFLGVSSNLEIGYEQAKKYIESNYYNYGLTEGKTVTKKIINNLITYTIETINNFNS